MQQNWKVTIQGDGRSGIIEYWEEEKRIEFGWEIGGAKGIILIIQGPEPWDWDKSNPWAAGRRDEILNRVANEAIRQRATYCVPDIHPRSGIFYIREKDSKSS
jgi:hypothetical protein